MPGNETNKKTIHEIYMEKSHSRWNDIDNKIAKVITDSKILIDEALSNGGGSGQGPKGEKGEPGIQGIPGPRGLPGEKGEPGEISLEVETKISEMDEVISDLRRRLVILENEIDSPNIEKIVFGDVLDIKDHFAIAVSDSGILMLSEDYGETYTKTIDVSSVGMIKMVHPFTDGTVLFCSDDRAYTTKDFLTFSQSVTLDLNGTPFFPTSLDNFSIQCKDSKNQIIDDLEVLVWGNYAHQGANAYGAIKLWYTTDKGKTLRIAYKFADDVSDQEIRALHIHGVIFYPVDQSFWILTGDHTVDGREESHFIKGFYNKETDTWSWNVIGSGNNFKAGNIVFYEGYAYWSWDTTPGGVVRCLYEDIADISKHELLLSTPNDCLDIVISTHGEIIATQTMWGNTDPPRNFYYSADRINFHRIEGLMPQGSVPMSMYNVIKINGANQVIGGVLNPVPGWQLTTWNLKPSAYLDKMVRNAGFKNAFLPPTISKAPTITVNPPEGEFHSAISIELISSKPSTIYYTIDGSEPTVNSNIYSGVITVTPPLTLRYFGVGNSDGSFSIPISLNYTLSDEPKIPILHYDFRGKTNLDTNREIIEDLSPNKVDAALTNFAFSGTSGYVNEGLSFDKNSGNHIYTKVSDNIFEEGTMIAYFKPSDLGNDVLDYYPSVFSNLSDVIRDEDTKGFTIDLLHSLMYIEFAKIGTMTNYYTVEEQGISINEWNHLTITHVNDIFTVYHDGKQVFKNTSILEPMTRNIQEFVIGRFDIKHERFPFEGVVAYVKAFDSVLTPEEVLQEFQNRE